MSLPKQANITILPDKAFKKHKSYPAILSLAPRRTPHEFQICTIWSETPGVRFANFRLSALSQVVVFWPGAMPSGRAVERPASRRPCELRAAATCPSGNRLRFRRQGSVMVSSAAASSALLCSASSGCRHHQPLTRTQRTTTFLHIVDRGSQEFRENVTIIQLKLFFQSRYNVARDHVKNFQKIFIII